jgi:hypothetical protein
MNAPTAIAREVTGLFLDGGWLALGILIVVALTGISESIMADTPIVGGGILLFGCLTVIFVNVLRVGPN